MRVVDEDAGPPTGDEVLLATGLIDHAGVPTVEGRAVMSVWDAPTLAVELELLLATRQGRVRLRSWHRNRDEWVVCLSTADGRRFELAWFAAADWWLELGRVAHVDRRRLGTAPEMEQPLPEVIETPWELLLATGEAVGSGRSELIAPLVADYTGMTLAGSSIESQRTATDAEASLWHADLERASRGRLHATIAGRSERGRPGVGVVEWVLFHDGWRSLTAFRRDGWNMVRIERQEPTELSRQLAVRAAKVAS